MCKTGIIAKMTVGATLVVALVGCGEENETQAPRNTGGGAVNVEAVVAEIVDLESSVRGLGIVLSAKEVEIQSEAVGKIKAIYFKDGQSVRTGYNLLKIEDANVKAASLKANAKLKLSRNSMYRKKQQYDAEAISTQDYEIALSDLQMAEADSADAAANLLKTRILAPFNGKLGIGKVTLGERLNVGDPIVKIVQKFPLKIDFSVADKYASVLKSGMEVEINKDSKSYKAKIEALESSLDGSTRTMQVRAVISGEPEELVPGAPVEFLLDLPARQSLTVPPEAIGSDAMGSTAYLYKDGKAELVRIEIGTRFVDRVEITSGVSAGDTVLCVGASPVRNGGSVAISRMRESLQ